MSGSRDSGPADIDDVRREIGARARLVRVADQSLAVEEDEGKLLVSPRRARRDRQRLAVDADLERLLDGDLVALAVAPHDGERLVVEVRQPGVELAGLQAVGDPVVEYTIGLVTASGSQRSPVIESCSAFTLELDNHLQTPERALAL